MSTPTPQTNTQVNPDAFKALILSKYPDGVANDGTKYADMNAQDLTQRIVSKYPDGVTNAGIKYSDYLGGANTQTNQPSQTQGEFDSLKKVGDAVQSFFPGKQIGQDIGTLGGYAFTKAQDLVKGTHNADNYDLSAPSPLQAAGDVAKGAALVGGFGANPATLLGTAATGAGFGALGGAGQAATQTSGAPIPTAADVAQVAKGGATGAVVGGIVSGGIGALGKLLGSAGDQITNSVIRPSKADVEDGFSLDTVKKYNLGGSLNQTLKKSEAAMKDLSDQLKEKLAGSNSSIDIAKVYDDTEKALTENKLSNFGANTSMTKALSQLQDEVLTANPTGSVSIPDAQVVKRAAGHYGAWNYGVPDPDSTARQTVYNTFYNKMKTAIEDNSPEGVKEINSKMSKIIPVMNAVIRRIPIAERNNVLSLGDIVGLTGGLLNPKAFGSLALSVLSKSGNVGNLLGKVGPTIQSLAPGAGSVASYAFGGGNSSGPSQ